MTTEFAIDKLKHIIGMAWEDRTPFDAITLQSTIKEQEAIEPMRQEMKSNSFRLGCKVAQQVIRKNDLLKQDTLNAQNKNK